MPAADTIVGQGRSELLRGSNHVMRELMAGDTHGVMPFFCECDRAGCFAPAWLTVAEYDHARVQGASIFAQADALARAL